MNQAHFDGDHHQLEKCTCMHHPGPSSEQLDDFAGYVFVRGTKDGRAKKSMASALSVAVRGHDVTESRSLVIDAIASPIY